MSRIYDFLGSDKLDSAETATVKRGEILDFIIFHSAKALRESNKYRAPIRLQFDPKITNLIAVGATTRFLRNLSI